MQAKDREFKKKSEIQMDAAIVPISSIVEPSGVCGSDGKRAVGLTVMPWIKDKSLLWDFTSKDTFCPSNIASKSRKAGSATENAVVSKKMYIKK